ncbi:DUF4829 domain-containing protein [Clostridium felsineum]|uniref:Uncharacterized protein n=1 Tax=Clostridium felsineum TaxID=36839 RepID=A0A1S8KY24_9CLOT|nr:DUF4829 domain-containing protein [Clostridium felsineum]URZ08253.1 hypothetical protein CLROS_036210 [Clostridium felsineum]URZ13284.1 hypothetical protein CROST_040360 [Clostridium felsineum]
MKNKLALTILILILLFTGCSVNKEVNISNAEKLKLKPNEVIKNYFKYYNEKSRTGVLSTLTDWQNKPNLVLGFNKLKSIKLNTIIEDTDPKEKDIYMKYGRGKVNGVKDADVKNYKVTFTIEYKNNEGGPIKNGKHFEWFTVIRKNKNSAWLIDEHGEG